MLPLPMGSVEAEEAHMHTAAGSCPLSPLRPETKGQSSALIHSSSPKANPAFSSPGRYLQDFSPWRPAWSCWRCCRRSGGSATMCSRTA